MSNLFRSKKAVSPVVATVLIIAVALSGAALIYVIVNDTFEEELPTFGFTVQNSLDYNNDGKADVLDLKVVNIGTVVANTTYVAIENWEIIPGGNIRLQPNQEAIVRIGTNSISSQFEQNDKVKLGMGPFEDRFRLAEIIVGEITTPASTKVYVTSDSEPVVGLSITFENDEGLPAGIAPVTTNTLGIASAYLLPDYYVAHTSSGQDSAMFHNVLANQVSIGALGEKIYVTVVDDADVPVQGITVYDADSQQNDLGGFSTTDSNGLVSFTESDGTYIFRVNYLGIDYWSSSTTVPNASNVTIKLTTNAELIGQLQFGGNPAGSGKLLRLYTSTNASMGRYDYTNSTSFFEFTSGVSPGVYQLRLDYQGNRYWSGLVSTSDPNLIVDFGGGNMNILVTAGGAPLPSGVLTRLYTSNEVSTGRYDYLNTSGVAEYPNTPGAQYKLRIDWLGRRIFSGVFTHQNSVIQEIDVGGGPLNILVTAGGTPLPNGVLTRLYNANNVSSGRYDYLNASGHAEYGAIPDGDYRLRVDWLGQQIYTESFPHTDGSPVFRDIGGGNLKIQILAGGVPLPNGVLTRLYNANGVSSGRYDYVNSTGWAEYGAIPDGDYKLRIDWLGQRQFTIVFSVNNSNPITLTIPGGALTVQILAGGTPLPNGVLTRLYLESGVSTGRYDYLNSTGFAEYGAILGANYKLRVDWLGQQIYTTNFTLSGSGNFIVDIGGGGLTVQVTAGGVPLRNGVLTRLYNDVGSSSGRYDYLNGSGFAEYGAIPEGDYKLRIDWLGKQYWTNVFVHTTGTPFVRDIGGGLLNITLTVNGVALPNGVLTRLYHDDGTNTGLYDYLDVSGNANYSAIPAGDFKLRVDWMGKQFWTNTSLTHDGQPEYTLELDGVGTMTITLDGPGYTNGINQIIRLYHADGTNTGRYAYTDGSDEVTFFAVPTQFGQYMVRYGSVNSNSFDASPAVTATIP